MTCVERKTGAPVGYGLLKDLMLKNKRLWNRDNILYCNSHGIRLSGKRLGRPKKDADSKAEKKIAYMDNTDRIEVERKFSLGMQYSTKSSAYFRSLAQNG